MNALDFNIKAGWPGSTETWEFLQNMIKQAQDAAWLGGRNFIISGCVQSAGNVSDGKIFVNGEILPFVGGPLQPKIIVVDTVDTREFFGGAVNPYYHTSVAQFGSGTGEVAWADLKRNNPDNGVLARLDKVEKMLTPLMGYTVGGVMQYGSWLFWGRPAAEIPTGWEPVPDADWKGRVPVVLDPDDFAFDTVGKTGGEKTHALTQAELPNINLRAKPKGVGGINNTPSGGGYGFGSDKSPAPEDLLVPLGGSGTKFNVLQPYKVVMFIRFTG